MLGIINDVPDRTQVISGSSDAIVCIETYKTYKTMNPQIQFAAIATSIYLLILFIICLIILINKQNRKKEKMAPQKSLKESNGLDLLYQSNVQSIDQFKNRQWQITYYTLAILGAIIGITRLEIINKILISEYYVRYFLLFLSEVITGFGIYTILKIEYSIIEARILVYKNEKLSKLANYWMTDKEYEDTKKKIVKLGWDKLFLILFISSIIIVFTLVLLVIFTTGQLNGNKSSINRN